MSIEIWIPDGMWQDGSSPDGSRLITKLVINGTSMHLEAWEVRVDEGTQELTEPQDPNDLDNLAVAVSANGHMDTTEINGREYILVATPYC